ncbi:PAS domain-containing protein [Alkalimarinus sediminis]|uniref:PAS domain S-box protein n=1 Tax=Alkalimarinus sediminis TaxID=1632866 RepID=A0A9E8HLB0_9ALTE|nr:PAS domain S-box protein [Alkalimarinus sediminis]UZW74793.1 PAS domain S-box protein [Alkalimarinus sediminis]
MMLKEKDSALSIIAPSTLWALCATAVYWYISVLMEPGALSKNLLSPSVDRLSFTLFAFILSFVLHGHLFRTTRYYKQVLKEQQRCNTLIKESTDITLIMSEKGTCNYISPSIKQILGFRPEEITGKPFQSLLNPSLASRTEIILNNAIKEQTVALPVSLQCLDKWGRNHHLEGTIANMLKVPAIEGLIVNLRDTTAQVNAEIARDQIQTKYKNLFFNNEVAIWEEDYSSVYHELQKLREMGIESITDYLQRNNEQRARLASMVRINEINQATLLLFNASSPKDFIDHINEITNEQYLDIFEAQLNAIWKGEQHFQSDATYQTLDGNEIHVRLYMPIPDTEEDFRHIPISRQNITDRKNAEQALKRSQHQLAEAQRLAKLGSWEWSVADHNVICSKETYRILGYEMPPLTIHKDEFIGRVHPEDRTRVKEAIYNAIEHVGTINLDYRVLTPDGHCQIVNAIAEAIFEADGKVSHMVGTLQDVTKQRQNEERMILANRMFEHTHEGIFITDQHSNIIAVNQAFTTITGYTLDEAYGQTPQILHSGRHTKQFYQNMWAEIKERGCWQGEVWNKAKNGQLYSEWLMINEVKDQQANTINYIGTFSDIHKAKENHQVALRSL